jgi:hypothetical protein
MLVDNTILTDRETLQAHPGLARVNEILDAAEALVSKVVNPNTALKCVVIAGPPGIGKTHSAMTALNRDPNVYKHLYKGYMTPFKFYEALSSAPGWNDAYIFDDCDGIFNNVQALNVLKAVVDPETQYAVSWHSSRAEVKSFRFLGKIVILTNYMLHISPHYQAFLDRVLYYPIALTKEEVLLKVAEIAHMTSFFNFGKRSASVNEILVWMNENMDNFRTDITFRTFEAALELSRSFPDEQWREMARHTLLAS